MHRFPIVLLLGVLLPTPALADLLIDDYEVGSFAVTDADTTIVFTRVTQPGLDPAHVLGGERTVFVNTPAPGPLTTFGLFTNGGDDSASCSIPQDQASCGTEVLDLGGLDFTQAGANDRFRVRLSAVSGTGTFFSVRVATGTGAAVAQEFVNGAGSYEVLFSEFLGTPDMTDVLEAAVGLGGDAGSTVEISEFRVGAAAQVPALSGPARLVVSGLLLLAGALPSASGSCRWGRAQPPVG